MPDWRLDDHDVDELKQSVRLGVSFAQPTDHYAFRASLCFPIGRTFLRC
jgi:hypothetical protein